MLGFYVVYGWIILPVSFMIKKNIKKKRSCNWEDILKYRMRFELYPKLELQTQWFQPK